MKVWSLLSIPDEERKYAGNRGYIDELRTVYRYDSAVSNSKSIQEGDIAVLRNRNHLLGTATIERINTYNGFKTRLRCPNCSLTSLKIRKNKHFYYRCGKCGSETNTPIETKEKCILYEAWFGSTFVELDTEFTTEDQIKISLRYNEQHAMQEVNPDILIQILHGLHKTQFQILINQRNSKTQTNQYHGHYRNGFRLQNKEQQNIKQYLQHDPALLERALEAHSEVQDSFAMYLTNIGYTPMSPTGGIPYDIAWFNQDKLFIGEVKSITLLNEVTQIRSGIGQLLDYACEFERRGQHIGGLYLIIEQQPSEPDRWIRVCARAGIHLIWFPNFSLQETPAPYEQLALYR